jgi:hypothetical protein
MQPHFRNLAIQYVPTVEFLQHCEEFNHLDTFATMINGRLHFALNL